ncbi:hypothetical protein ACFL3A_08525 [Pseudomonadota bacterium]
MNPDTLVNAFVDFANGDISRDVAESKIEAELEKSPNLNEIDGQAIKDLIEEYSISGDVAGFVARVSEIISKLPEVAGWAADNKE